MSSGDGTMSSINLKNGKVLNRTEDGKCNTIINYLLKLYILILKVIIKRNMVTISNSNFVIILDIFQAII